MTDLQSRLERCFITVFPELAPDEVTRASVASLASWDSVATATLLAVVEEEFETEFDPDEVGLLISFELTLEALRGKHLGT